MLHLEIKPGGNKMKEYYKKMSRQAIEYVNIKVPVGANNLPHARQDEALVALSTERSDAALSGMSSAITKGGALVSGAGNCGEQSEIAYSYFYKKHVYPVDFISGRTDRVYYDGRPSDHAFLALGIVRGPGFDIKDHSTWGGDVIICDPWINQTRELADYWGLGIFDHTWNFVSVKQLERQDRFRESPF